MTEEHSTDSTFDSPSGDTAQAAAETTSPEVAEDQGPPVPSQSEAAPEPIEPALPLSEAVPEPAVAAPPAGTPRLTVSALSDIGCVRSNNEDSYGYDQELGIFVVCDGMGGMASGEVASSRAVAALVNSYAESAPSGMPVSTRLLQAIRAANQDVWEVGQLPEHRGMGTTAVMAAVEGDKLIVGNVGDSRAYLLQGGQCLQLTIDHSYLNELIRNGTLTLENAHTADLQGYESVITRAIGVAPTIEPDFYSLDLTPGTMVLLSTDGLSRYLSQDEISAILQASQFESACANLISLAKQRGGQDNITCLILAVLPE